MALIRANHDSINDRFSVLGFTVRTEHPLFEIGLATEPELLKAENRQRRSANNFFASRLLGASARNGEAVYLVPPSVVARFVGQPRLYFGLATYHEGDRSQPASVKIPDRGNMYVNLAGLTERGLRRTARSNGVSSYGNGSTDALTWGGDALTAGAPVRVPVNGKGNGNGNGTAHAAAPAAGAAPYSDGYSDDLWQQDQAAAPAAGAGGATNGAAPVVAPAVAQAWRSYGLSEDALDDRGIEGPIPDYNPADDPTFSTPQGLRAISRPLNAPSPEYPQAARFVPAAASNFRATTSPRSIERIVIHITDGGASINGTIGWFQNPKAQVSAHYVIGQDGEVVQMVRHADVAWHARSANTRSIGIEHVANTKGLNPTPAQLRASAALVSWLCNQYAIAVDRTHILGHAEADTATTHTGCPNAVWDWDAYMGLVTAQGSHAPAVISQGLARRSVRQPNRPSRSRHSGPNTHALLVESFYQPTGWFDALTTQAGFFLKGALWFLGVPDTTVPPHSAVCQVRTPTANGDDGRGTAFFISPRLLLTAAHVLWGQSELIIVPGKNGAGSTGATEPFGRFRVRAADWVMHPSYAGDANHDFDLALICVPEANCARPGNYFDLVEELTQSRPEGVVVNGYAAWWNADDAVEHFVNANIDSNKQHLHGGHVRFLPTEETFAYDLQTLGGTSGGPVYWIEEGAHPRAHVVGVHVDEHSDTTNLGCRISPAKLAWIRSTASAWGQALSFSLGRTRGLGQDVANAVSEDDPDAFGITEPIPDEFAAAATTQALRPRALEAPLPDYPGADRFAPAHPRNFTVARSARSIDRVVVHITAGGSRIEGTVGWFQNPDQRNSRDEPIRVSSHYIVGRAGEVVQMVHDKDYAHHASSANRRSIGIEHNANKTTGLNPTEPQYEASARLVAWLCAQYGLPVDREHIVGHQEISPRDHHECPSSIWDWDHYMACVQLASTAIAASGTVGTATAQGLGAGRRRAYAVAQEIITPFYDPADPATALMCQADAFSLAREEWFAGVPNTTIFPHSAICLLEMNDGSGGIARGTGFYIGPNRILTCGHNLFGQASVDIIPGNNGQGNEPFGRCTVTSGAWRIPAGYGGSNPAYDLAVIDNVPIAAPNGWWFPVLEELNQSRPEGVVVCGYSSRSTKVPDLTAAIDGFKQHLHAGYIAALGAGDSTFDYPILTLKRASGSPVYYISDKDGTQKAYIVGVHTGSATDDLNRGCRLTAAKIDWIEGRTTSLSLGAGAYGRGAPRPDAAFASARAKRQAARGPVARAQEIITPFYDPADPSTALTCQDNAFSLAREEWFVGVEATHAFPHSAICALAMTDGAGDRWAGTGFYIGRNRILTCAHNLHGMVSVTVTPGQNGAGSTPFGQCTLPASAWRVAPRYSGDGNWENDLAVIDNLPIEAPNGQWFEFLNATPSDRLPIVVCGYSAASRAVPELTAAIDGDKQHLHGGYAATMSNGEVIEYPILTLQGASGSPVYHLDRSSGQLKAQICAVHVTGQPAAAGLNRGCFITPAKIDWIEGRATSFALGMGSPLGASTRALSGGEADLPVALIPQPDKNACWAAAMAMLLSYRRNASYSPETLANEVGASLASSYGWELLEAVKPRYGFAMIEQPSNSSLYHSPQQWADWLSSHGPLWVVIVGAPHAVVVAGIRGNLADPSSVQVKILNPWDTRVAFDNDPVAFNPRNNGYEDWLSFNQFAADFGNMAQPDYGNWRVLYLPATAAVAQSLGDRGGDGRFRLAHPPAAIRALEEGPDVAAGESREPIEPTRVPGTRMSAVRGSAGGSRWALDQLEGFSEPAMAGQVVSPSETTDVNIELGAWPAIEGEPSPLPLTISFRGTRRGAVGEVQIRAGSPANLAYGVEVVARIDNDGDIGNLASLKVGIDYRFSGLAQGAPAARIELRLLGDGRYERVNRWLATTQAA